MEGTIKELGSVVISAVFFGATLLIVVAVLFARHRARQMRHETIRLAVRPKNLKRTVSRTL